jgi:hypothetical protein
MRTPENSSRLARQRTVVIDFPPVSQLEPGAYDMSTFPVPSGAKEGDSITITTLANAAGQPYFTYSAPSLVFQICFLTPILLGVRVTNCAASANDVPLTRLRLTFTRP